MPPKFICAIWTSVSLLLCGSAAFIFNSSSYSLPLNVTSVEDEESVDWESPFLQLRANLPSYSQPIRPYTLLTNAEDYHYMPKPRHRRPARLLRLLGSSFDLFWMSIEKPTESSGGNNDGQMLDDDMRVKKTAAHFLQKLEKEAADLDLDYLPSHVASSVRDWLVRSATCRLSHKWVDLGPVFWPRWLRQTDCERSDGEKSCSFPAGMECVRAQTTHIKILAWHCMESREGRDGSRGIKSDRSDGRTELVTAEVVKRCVWRQVPYPVVTACTCSCK